MLKKVDQAALREEGGRPLISNLSHKKKKNKKKKGGSISPNRDLGRGPYKKPSNEGFWKGNGQSSRK